ncbi:MAG: DUF4432 family protein [Pseudomonadota bacterium]|nr:DUF4432 family protein [Pseudomonadota bacterium]
MRLPESTALRPLVGDLRQVASVRRIMLDDGVERGVRALAFSTGGGLDFWVMVDRTLDIGTLSWRGVQLGWQSPAGLRSPWLASPDSDGGFGFNRGFGGFLNTCGLDHIRQPRDGRPLHGRLPFTPARLTAWGEDWGAEEPLLYCEGEIVQWRYGGEAFRLRRRIEAPIGAATFRILDKIENIGPTPAPVAVLYHFNLGYPAVAAGTTLYLDDARMAGPLAMPETGPVAPASVHASLAVETARCRVSTPAGDDARRSIEFRWRNDTLPYLQLWRDLRPHCGVLSIEPCSIGRTPDGANEPAEPLGPGERRSFRVEITLDGPTPASDPLRQPP